MTSGPYVLIDPPERFWIDDDGALHVHGFSAAGPMTGDIGGTIFFVQYEGIDTLTGEGEYRGARAESLGFTSGRRCYAAISR